MFSESIYRNRAIEAPNGGFGYSCLELPTTLRLASIRNSRYVDALKLSDADPVMSKVRLQEYEDLTFAHTGMTETELKQKQTDLETARIQRDFGAVAINYDWD